MMKQYWPVFSVSKTHFDPNCLYFHFYSQSRTLKAVKDVNVLPHKSDTSSQQAVKPKSQPVKVMALDEYKATLASSKPPVKCLTHIACTKSSFLCIV